MWATTLHSSGKAGGVGQKAACIRLEGRAGDVGLKAALIQRLTRREFVGHFIYLVGRSLQQSDNGGIGKHLGELGLGMSRCWQEKLGREI